MQPARHTLKGTEAISEVKGVCTLALLNSAERWYLKTASTVRLNSIARWMRPLVDSVGRRQGIVSCRIEDRGKVAVIGRTWLFPTLNQSVE